MEEAHEDVVLALEDRLLVLLRGGVGQLLHGRAELRAGKGRGGDLVLQHGRGVTLQRPLRHLGAREVPADGLALDGEAQVASGQRRLGGSFSFRLFSSAPMRQA